jgi:hypothetical protein
MATKKLTWVLFGMLVISAWVLQAGAETMKCRSSGIPYRSQQGIFGKILSLLKAPETPILLGWQDMCNSWVSMPPPPIYTVMGTLQEHQSSGVR